MAGNSKRRGAVRAPGSKKGARVGSGGRGKQALEGRGPTPKAEDRPYHAAYKRKQSGGRDAGRSDAGRGRADAGRSRGGSDRSPRSGTSAHGGTEVVTGRNSVVEAMRAGIPVQAVYVATRIEHDDRTREILSATAKRALPLLEVTRQELDQLTDRAIHQGVALQVPPYEYAHPEDLLAAADRSGRPPLIVALDGVTDPRNLGAVLRSAGAFGVHGVLVPERRSVGMTASAWKVSAGAAARVPVARAANLNRALEAYRAAGLFVVGLDAGGDAPIGEVAVATEPLVVVVGSEGKGLSRAVRDKCDLIASIPIAESTESLNAAVAAGITLYEVARRRAEVS